MPSLGRRAVALTSLLIVPALALCIAAGHVDTLRADIELSTKEVGSRETVLGDLTADAIRAAAKSDAAFIAASSFGDVTIPKGAVGTADVLKALDYKDDTISIVKLTGDQIRAALEHGLYLYPKTNSGFLQFSGLVVVVNPDADREQRVVSVRINGETATANKTYHVAMPAPLANGALAYFKVWKKSDIEKDTGKTLESALTSYLSDHKTLTKGDERLVIKSK